MKRQLKKIVCLALITSMILGQKTLNTTKNVTAKEKKDIKIAIDAGHQARGNFATEPVGPGSSTRKAKVAGGATGVASHVPEYKLTLAVSKKAMESQELAVQELLQMLPPSSSSGYQFDVYA